MKHRISIFQVILILLIMLGLFLIGKGIIENISFSIVLTVLNQQLDILQTTKYIVNDM